MVPNKIKGKAPENPLKITPLLSRKIKYTKSPKFNKNIRTKKVDVFARKSVEGDVEKAPK
jgi:hypothetical protein